MARPDNGHRTAQGDDHGHAHGPTVAVYLAVFAALLVLTAVTVWAANQDFGPLNLAVALGIAVTKATLVVLFFMHVKYSSRLTWLVVAGAFVWLGFLVLGTLHDYYSPHFTPGRQTPTISRE